MKMIQKVVDHSKKGDNLKNEDNPKPKTVYIRYPLSRYPVYFCIGTQYTLYSFPVSMSNFPAPCVLRQCTVVFA